jgi:EAL domain-containing protein (putative c-di-GMP-specific phosphodiesterase class I)
VVFVKLSAESLLDTELPEWVGQQLAPHGLEPHNICFQVSEEDASHYMNQTRSLAETLRQKGFRFAIENFGVGRDPKAVLNSTPMDFIKLDGSLMSTISGDNKLQERIRDLAGIASRRSISTIATHVENANTMAVLFQLGVGYMQGHYIQEPDVILEEAV